MWRFAVARRWWVGHAAVVGFCLVFLALGDWQWDRAHSATGSWQNLGYALQWPMFAVFLIAAWARFLWLEQHVGRDGAVSDDAVSGDAGTDEHAATPEPDPAEPAPQRPAQRHRQHAPRPIVEDDPDDELAAYNAYLAQLAAQDRRR